MSKVQGFGMIIMKNRTKVCLWAIGIHAGISLLLLACMIPFVFFHVAQSFPSLWLIYRGVAFILGPVIGAMYILDYATWSNPFVFTTLVLLNSGLWGLLGLGIYLIVQKMKKREMPNKTSESTS
jgi:hypothetical protein